MRNVDYYDPAMVSNCSVVWYLEVFNASVIMMDW